ncbi:MAG: hypothetical protein B655_1190 [Methanobacterium sp. Maddingley MBC34]|nr:MAG: hypothetical protein B655_1190 [Methanobacterium sp. Maddingley MBC34]
MMGKVTHKISDDISKSKDKLKSALSKENIKSTLENGSLKQKLLVAGSTIPFLAASTMSSSCATTCPYGMVNDPFPGQCSRYMDIGGDGICDFSQATPVTTTDTSATTTDDTSTTTIDSGHGNGVNAESTVQDQVDANATTVPDSPSLDSGNLNGGDANNYFVLPISMLIIGGYLITHFLFKKGILKRTKHRRIWNLLLTAGYLGSGGTGVILALLINMGIRTALNPSLTFWHVELSILMVVGTLIHLHIYRKPFRNMFRVLFGFKSNSRRRNPNRVEGTSK